jgi:alkyl hydroperoxide reductase subunit AhpC
MIALHKEFDSKGVVQLAIAANQGELEPDSDPPHAAIRKHVKEKKVNFTVILDPGNKLTDIFGGRSTPHCFVIDKEGVIRYSGALDDDPRANKDKDEITYYVREAIVALLEGKDVKTKETRSYG